MYDGSKRSNPPTGQCGLELDSGPSAHGEQHAGMYAAVLDAFAAAVCIVEPDCRVRALNLAARRALTAGGELFVDHRLLSCRDPKAKARLARSVRDVCTLAGAWQDSFGISGERRLQIEICALRITKHDGRGSEALALVLFGQSDNEDYGEVRLRAMFGLSAAESCLLKELLSGKRLEECAEFRGTTIGTARTQLKSIFTKTGTTSQAQLVAVAKALPAIVARQPLGNQQTARSPAHGSRRVARRASASSGAVKGETPQVSSTKPESGPAFTATKGAPARADAGAGTSEASPWPGRLFTSPADSPAR